MEHDHEPDLPLTPGHPLFGQRCPFCGQFFEIGDVARTVCSGPADAKELRKARKGLPYVMGPDLELHFDCGDPKATGPHNKT